MVPWEPGTGRSDSGKVTPSRELKGDGEAEAPSRQRVQKGVHIFTWSVLWNF